MALDSNGGKQDSPVTNYLLSASMLPAHDTHLSRLVRLAQSCGAGQEVGALLL